MASTTNEDLKALIDRNHSDNTRRFGQIEQRLSIVESDIAALDSESMSRDEITELIDDRFGELQSTMEQVIDRRMVYYGRRILTLVAAPAIGLMFNLLQGWLT